MRLTIIPPTIITTMVCLMTKVLQLLQVMEYVDIGLLRTATISLVITDFFIVVTMAEVDLGLKRPTTISIAIVEFIILVLMAEAELGLNRPSTITSEIWKNLCMVIGEVDIGPIPSTITQIIQVTMVDCCVYMLIIVVLMILFTKI